MKCILCNSNELIFKMYPRDDKNLKIYSCKDCNLIQLHPRNLIDSKIFENGKLENQDVNRIVSIEDININKKKYLNGKSDLLNNIIHLLEADKFRYLNNFNKITNKFNLKKKDLNILDIGCGYGHWIDYLNSNYNHNVFGMDLNNNKINYGKNTLNLNFKYFIDKIENEEFISKNENKFDIITCWHVLEHVFDPILFIINIKRLLKKNGIFIFEVPNEDDELIKLVPEYSKLIHFKDHVNYFNINTLKLLFEKCGIKNEFYNIEGCQRYGFYNYIDWIRFKKKEKVLSDDYINLNDKNYLRSEIEKKWLEYRIDSLTCDTLFGYFINN